VSGEAGPANGKLDRGEAADICLQMVNWGAAAPATQARLVSLSPDVEVIDGIGAFGPAGEGDTVANSADKFRVRAAGAAPIEVPQYCELALSGPGYADTVRIPLIVGDSLNLPGGPDEYGYRIYDYTDSCYERRPDYDWVELRGRGTELPPGGDKTEVVALPQAFGEWRYYGQSYDSISICSNGWVAAGTSDRVDFVNVQLPYTGAPPRIVALCWDDLDPSDYGKVWFWHDSIGHRVIVEFDSVPYFGHRQDWEQVQFQLSDRTVSTPTGDNSMSVHFKTANDCRNVTVGLQNQDGTVGLTHCWNDWYPAVAAPMRAGTALRFETSAQAPVVEPERVPAGPGFSVEPNPFRRAADICLANPLARGAVLQVFDPAGRCIEQLRPGPDCRSRFRWQARLLPGVYFVRLDGRSVRAVVVP